MVSQLPQCPNLHDFLPRSKPRWLSLTSESSARSNGFEWQTTTWTLWGHRGALDSWDSCRVWQIQRSAASSDRSGIPRIRENAVSQIRRSQMQSRSNSYKVFYVREFLSVARLPLSQLGDLISDGSWIGRSSHRYLTLRGSNAVSNASPMRLTWELISVCCSVRIPWSYEWMAFLPVSSADPPSQCPIYWKNVNKPIRYMALCIHPAQTHD